MNWSRIIGNAGRTLIASGVLILLFVVYQLWGTALQERRAQNQLRGEFEELLEGAASDVTPLFELDNDELPSRLEPEAINQAAATSTENSATSTENSATSTENSATGTENSATSTENSATSTENSATSPADSATVTEGSAASPSSTSAPIAGSGDVTTSGTGAGAIAVDPSALIIDPESIAFGPPPPPPEGGDAVARLRIPAIGLDKVVVEGVGTEPLKDGPGHYPGTPLPGQRGNASIAGHRTTYGAPFYNLDELEVNDLIYTTTAQGAFQYRVTNSFVVEPSDVWVLDPSTDNRLTLTTCHPRYSARERLVVVAELIGPAASGGPGEQQSPAQQLASMPGEDFGGAEDAAEDDDTAAGNDAGADDREPEAAPVATTPPVAGHGTLTVDRADAPAQTDGLTTHLDGDRSATWPAIFWGALAGFVWTLTWVASRQWRRWPSYLVGGAVFLVVLFVFFENFSRLLPPGV